MSGSSRSSRSVIRSPLPGWLGGLAGLLALAAAAGCAGTADTLPADYAFVDVNVVPMDSDRVLEGQTVLVAGERIVAVGPAAEITVPDGAETIDGAGGYLMPGLAEMHAHIPPEDAGSEWIEQVLFLYVANGITTVRGMLGQPAHRRLKRQVAAGEVLGPRIYTSGPSLNGNSIPEPDSARRAVIHQAQAGYDFLKLHPGLSLEVFDAMDRTADSVGIEFAGHVSAAVGLRRALEAGYATIDHLDGYVRALVPEDASVDPTDAQFFGFNLVGHLDESRIPELARATREAGVWNVPTMSLFVDFVQGEPESLSARPDVRYVPAEMSERWLQAVRNIRGNEGFSPERGERFLEVRRRILGALHEAGAGLLLGSDAPQVFNVPGFSIHEELAELVSAGLSPYEALVTGTRNVATFFGAEQEYGTVEPDRIADLILLDANPLTDVGNVRRRAGVMLRGRWLPEAEIQRRLDEIAAGHAAE